ncbi:hypothetical protein C7S18_23300 [Ahniella affigens]|uniref:Cytochrome b561 bacterial/Ni-hydrogenase domain-containing protein n=1 Tax=Ahniella affigens TaxID=2021234 RepID=A0A2P1PYK4_9GAMM|nr:cytochrome b/b6 domain-containing protein [Ahniella affigens]AVP99921.1 hypothetical protein C7S18_23300 [Ahniella affigens]
MTHSIQKWPIPVRSLHWLMAVMLIVQWASGNWDDWLGVRNHVSLGLLVLPLALIRLLARLTGETPDTGATKTLPDRVAALVHALFYMIMIALPISGVLWRQAGGRAVSFFGWFDLPTLVAPNKTFAHTLHEVHEVLGTVFLVLLALHVLGALKRQFLDRQPLMQRLL